MDSTKIGNYIATLRKAHNWTQSELANMLNVSDKAVSKWEGGNGLPDISIIPILAKMFGVTTDELLSGEGKKPSANNSVYAKIASGNLDLLAEIENGLKIDNLDEYGKSLADYCAEANNIEIFRLIVKLNKVVVANKTENRSTSSGRETITYEDVLLYDKAYYTGKYDNPYPKNYSDSALFCLVLKNRADELLGQLNIENRIFNDAEAEIIADDFDYFYKKYFSQAFPSHIGKLLCALVKKGKTKESQMLLNLITDHKAAMEKKRADCEREHNILGKKNNWTIHWNSGEVFPSVFDKKLKKSVIMHDKAIAHVWGTNERPYIIGNSIIISQSDLEEIGFINPDFLVECKKIGYAPSINEQLLSRLLEKDDIKIFEAFTAGVTLNAELEKLILNSTGNIKVKYIKSNTPKNINDAIASSDIELVMSMVSTPKATLQYFKEVDIKLLGNVNMLPLLTKFLPFFTSKQLDYLLENVVELDNVQARILLIEHGASLYRINERGVREKDKTQTDILYRLLKSEVN